MLTVGRSVSDLLVSLLKVCDGSELGWRWKGAWEC